ncbi:hypothetical protein BJ878DRAFT_72426 [Calycina marina]|uniref:Uncharacterized protein n=1 Tax=Calycina marina TaxID=1763456 RepID=A0A9P8CER8_9HELO|nr:hypothetical protein BJ878DRAFT_72426 [Calycina marina]
MNLQNIVEETSMTLSSHRHDTRSPIISSFTSTAASSTSIPTPEASYIHQLLHNAYPGLFTLVIGLGLLALVCSIWFSPRRLLMRMRNDPTTQIPLQPHPTTLIPLYPYGRNHVQRNSVVDDRSSNDGSPAKLIWTPEGLSMEYLRDNRPLGQSCAGAGAGADGLARPDSAVVHEGREYTNERRVHGWVVRSGGGTPPPGYSSADAAPPAPPGYTWMV